MNTNSKSEHHPYDKSFRYMSGEYPGYLHANLNLPGKYIKSCENDVVSHEKINLRMDLLILVGPDGGSVKENILINLEHQSEKLDDEKIKKIAKYKDFSKCRHHCPILSMIVTPHEPENQIQEYGITESDITKPVFIHMDNEEIKKRFNNLETKIKNKSKLENHEILDFGIISIFASYNNIIEKLCKLYKDSRYVKGKVRRDMSLILDLMIKVRFKGNKEKIVELENMIEEDREAARRGMRIYYEEEFAKINSDWEKELAQKDADYAKEIAGKNIEKGIRDKEIIEKNIEIGIRDNEIIEKNIEISEKDNEISIKDNEISIKDNEINELKNQRQEYKNIIDKLKENGEIDSEIYDKINSVFE